MVYIWDPLKVILVIYLSFLPKEWRVLCFKKFGPPQKLRVRLLQCGASHIKNRTWRVRSSLQKKQTLALCYSKISSPSPHFRIPSSLPYAPKLTVTWFLVLHISLYAFLWSCQVLIHHSIFSGKTHFINPISLSLSLKFINFFSFIHVDHLFLYFPYFNKLIVY